MGTKRRMFDTTTWGLFAFLIVICVAAAVLMGCGGKNQYLTTDQAEALIQSNHEDLRQDMLRLGNDIKESNATSHGNIKKMVDDCICPNYAK